MDVFAFFQAEQIRDTGILAKSYYLDQFCCIEEKFKIWQSLELLERAEIFKKVVSLSSYHNDMLSEMLVKEMKVLLDKVI